MRGPNGRRIRNETRSWLEEARIASLSSAAHEQVETVGDPGLGLSADGTSAADMDYCADPQRLFIEENCGSSRHDADRARWQALWESDESISRLKADHDVDAEHVMCIGITTHGKLVGVLQVMNKVPQGSELDPMPCIFTSNDREQAETFCQHVTSVVAKACRQANYATAMENDHFLASFANDQTAHKIQRKTSWRAAAASGLGREMMSAGSPAPVTPRLVSTVNKLVERPLCEWSKLPSMEELRAWGFDAMSCTISQLVACTIKIFEERGFLAEGAAVGCSQHTMEMFAAVMLHDIYTQTPYHNAWHAFSTLQCVYALLHPDNSPELRELSQPEVFSALVAALCHDAGHDGSNNPFHTNCNAFSAEGADVLKVHGVNIGFLYNDQSVLENMHAHHCFATAKKLRCDIFARAKHHGTFKTIRKCIVGQILSTDMIFHKEKTDKLAAINKLDLQEEENRHFVLEMLVHGSDIGNTMFPWVGALKWGRMIGVEWSVQTAKEVRNGLPVTEWMKDVCADDLIDGEANVEGATESEGGKDRIFHAKNLGKGQSGFIEFVALPMFEVFARHFSFCQRFIEDGRNNVHQWVLAKERTQPLPAPTPRECELMAYARPLLTSSEHCVTGI